MIAKLICFFRHRSHWKTGSGGTLTRIKLTRCTLCGRVVKRERV